MGRLDRSRGIRKKKKKIKEQISSGGVTPEESLAEGEVAVWGEVSRRSSGFAQG